MRVASETTSLYPCLLGPEWNAVHPTVRNAHLMGDRLEGHGSFRVTHGGNKLARLLARVLLMPEETETGQVSLEVTRRGDHEYWHRTFDNRRLVTTQQAGPHGLLIERLACLEFRFRLEVDDGAIDYHQTTFGIRLGPLFLPIPARLSPQVTAREKAARVSQHTSVFVNVSVPLVGLVLNYEGTLQTER